MKLQPAKSLESSKALAQAKQILALDLEGVSNVGLDSLILLAHALSFSKEQVVFNPRLQLNETQQKNFFDLVTRRAKREPVSHLIGKREFLAPSTIIVPLRNNDCPIFI